MVTHDSHIAKSAPRLATIKAGQVTITDQVVEAPQAQPQTQGAY
jgi:putative ABC transport system ATP-binding protein